MSTHILKERKDALQQRLRILILQNAREGSVYDNRFLFEMHQISEQLLLIHQKEFGEKPVSGLTRMAGIVPAMVAHT